MNGTGIKGGAFGFRVSSINKVGHVDIRSIGYELTRLPGIAG